MDLENEREGIYVGAAHGGETSATFVEFYFHGAVDEFFMALSTLLLNRVPIAHEDVDFSIRIILDVIEQRAPTPAKGGSIRRIAPLTTDCIREMKALVDMLTDIIRMNHRHAIDLLCQTGGIEKLVRLWMQLNQASTRSHWSLVANILCMVGVDNVEQNQAAARAFGGSNVQQVIFELMWKGIANGCEPNAETL
jgi:hypothetical protein